MQEGTNKDSTPDMDQLILAIPVNIQTGGMSSIVRALAMAVWSWLVESFIDAKIAERGVVA